MALFDKIGEKITSTSKEVAKKTKNLTEAARLNMQISNEEDSIRNVYGQIGKLYYDLFSASPDERFVLLCTTITESLKKIDEYKNQIQTIKGVKKCPNCGAEIASSAVFCGICGKKTVAEEETPDEDPSQPKCANCGYPAMEGTAFCTNCGNAFSI
jgi:hypothetical protein